MKERESFNLAETRDAIYRRDHGVCRFCGNPVVYPGELAHRIPQTISNLRKYGKRRVHHPLNLALVCLRKPRCNDGMMIGYDPEAEAELIKSIDNNLEAQDD